MESFWGIARLLVNCACSLALIFSMCEYKGERKRAGVVLSGVGLFCTAVNSVLYLTVGREIMMRYFALILLGPVLIFLLSYTKDRISMLFFDFFTAINVLYLVSIFGHMAAGEKIWLDTLVRFLLYSLVIRLFDRFFRKPWHFLSKNMKHGWGVICVLPFLFFALVMYLGLYPRVRNDNYPAVIFLYFILALVYVVIYQVFRSTYAQLTQEENARLLTAQLSMQERQLRIQEDYLERLRIQRHDFRHAMRGLSVLLEKKDWEAAKEMTGRTAERFSELKPRQYCVRPVLNAVLSYYAEHARQKGIEVKLRRMELPDPLPVNETELSMVFGNALENACTACEKLPEGKERFIELTCSTFPQFVFEVANPYDGAPVKTDEEGYPVSGKPGHGTGSRSIAAFARKYGAVCDYKMEQGMFRVRILIPEGPEKSS